jgi:hypothetical protein
MKSLAPELLKSYSKQRKSRNKDYYPKQVGGRQDLLTSIDSPSHTTVERSIAKEWGNLD